MPKRVLRSVLLSVLLLSGSLVATNARAQQSEAMALQDAQNRVNSVLNATMQVVASQSKDFNEHLSSINALRPLDIANLDSEHVVTSVQQIMAFNAFLGTFAKSGDSLGRVLEDSLFVLRQQFPSVAPDHALEAFEKSFIADRKAFGNYITSLHKVYDQVLNVLLFMQNTKYHLGEKIEFVSNGDVARYQKLMTSLNAATKELSKASEESRKTAAWANKKIEEMNKSVSGDPNKSTKKRKG
jgi:hypothetical protein